jgi:hypothetical protein
MVEVLIVPAVADSLRAGDLTKLNVDEALARTVGDHLDRYRLLTTTLRIKEPNYLGVKVRAEIIPSEYSRPEVVQARVAESLRNFINPLAIATESAENGQPDGATAGLTDDDWEGWPFGRNLYVAEIFSLIQRVPGVKHVLDVQLSTRPVVPAKETLPEEEEEQESVAEPLAVVDQKVIRVSADTLLCSLDHEIASAGFEELEEELEEGNGD